MTESVKVALDNFSQGTNKIKRSLHNLHEAATEYIDFDIEAIDRDGEPMFCYPIQTDLGPVSFYVHCRKFFEFIDAHGSMTEIEFQELSEW